MWVTVKPLTINTELGKKKFISRTLRDMLTPKKAQGAGKGAVYAWFKFLTCSIIKNATSSPMLVSHQDEGHFSISGADIVWSIKNLPSETYLQALGYIFYKIVIVGGMKEYRCEMKKILSPYLVELGQNSVRKFGKKCRKARITQSSLESIAMTSEGILVLFHWIKKILTLTMPNADSRTVEDKKKKSLIAPSDVMWAFNWMRLNQLISVSFPLDVPDSIGACSGLGMKMKKRKRQSRVHSEEKFPCLPHDVIESHILPKLPFDFLLRLKCVCKEWKKTISSFHFQHLLGEQDAHQIQSFGIFNENRWRLKVRKCNGLGLFEVHGASPMDMSYISFVDSCRGFLCLRSYRDSTLFNIGNPVTGEWNSFLPPNVPEEGFHPTGPGLAVDLSSNRPWFKLVILACNDKEHLFHVFSSNTGEWKASNALLPQYYKAGDDNYQLERQTNSVHINDLLYWISVGRQLFWFDLERDVAGSIELPCQPRFCPAIGSLKTLGGEERLACTDNVHDLRLETYCLLAEGQWEKMFSIPINNYNFEPFFPHDGYIVHPFPYFGGEQQLAINNMRLVSYNIRTQKFSVVAKDYSQIISVGFFPFKMNLCPLPQISKSVILNR